MKPLFTFTTKKLHYTLHSIEPWKLTFYPLDSPDLTLNSTVMSQLNALSLDNSEDFGPLQDFLKKRHLKAKLSD